MNNANVLRDIMFNIVLKAFQFFPDNLTHFGHDGSSYFNNHRRTKHRMIMINSTRKLNWNKVIQLTGS